MAYLARGIFAIAFVIAVIILWRILSVNGKRFLTHTFNSNEVVVQSVHVLLMLGFWLLCIGLFLWNIGVASYTGNNYGTAAMLEDAAFRLGVSIFVIGVLHSANILVLAILNRKNA